MRDAAILIWDRASFLRAGQLSSALFSADPDVSSSAMISGSRARDRNDRFIVRTWIRTTTVITKPTSPRTVLISCNHCGKTLFKGIAPLKANAIPAAKAAALVGNCGLTLTSNSYEISMGVRLTLNVLPFRTVIRKVWGLPFPIPNLHTSYSFSVFKLLDNPASKKPL